MNDTAGTEGRLELQAKEFSRVMEETGLSVDELADKLAIKKDTLRKYAKGYQPASERLMKSLREVVRIRNAIVHNLPDVGGARGALADFIRQRGLTPAQLAKIIRYDSGVIEAVIHGGARASEKMIEAIVKEFPELTKEELMAGSDAPPVLGETVATYGAKPRIVLPPGIKGRMVPMISQAQAGTWDADHSDEFYEYESVFAFNVDDKRAFAVQVVGNSMEPRILEGDILIASPGTPLNNGDCAVVKTKSAQGFVKYWRQKGDRVYLESANPDYKVIDLPASEIARAWPVIQRIESGKVRHEK